MLDHLGEREAGARLLRAVEASAAMGFWHRDLGGSASTSEVGDAVANRVHTA